MLRIDDRLIHGQVIVGWCPRIKPDLVVLCNDEVAQSEMECEIYKDAAAEYKTIICTIEKTAQLLSSDKLKDEKILLITESPKDVVQLFKSGLQLDKVIIGGMHYQPGKRKIVDFIYISDEDLENLQFLNNQNVVLEGIDVPDSKSIDVSAILRLSPKGV